MYSAVSLIKRVELRLERMPRRHDCKLLESYKRGAQQYQCKFGSDLTTQCLPLENCTLKGWASSPTGDRNFCTFEMTSFAMLKCLRVPRPRRFGWTHGEGGLGAREEKRRERASLNTELNTGIVRLRNSDRYVLDAAQPRLPTIANFRLVDFD